MLQEIWAKQCQRDNDLSSRFPLQSKIEMELRNVPKALDIKMHQSLRHDKLTNTSPMAKINKQCDIVC